MTEAVDPRVSALVPGFDAPFFLAGLAGYSDGPFRLTCRALGAPYCVTEALQAGTLLRGGRGLSAADPATWLRGAEWTVRDEPLGAQLIGSTADEMARAAAELLPFGFAVIDVNLACPSKKCRRGRMAGGNLLTDPRRAIDILRAVREAVPASIPTSVKLRRAFDEGADHAHDFERVFDAAYGLGYAWATVHARTVEQRYRGPSRWSVLADLVRRYPDRLIFGSGDIWSDIDIVRMREETGVHAVSVARGALSDPWIFRRARGGDGRPPSPQEMGATLRLQRDWSVASRGERSAARWMRKCALQVWRLHPQAEAVRGAFIKCRTLRDFDAVLAEWYEPDAVEEVRA